MDVGESFQFCNSGNVLKHVLFTLIIKVSNILLREGYVSCNSMYMMVPKRLVSCWYNVRCYLNRINSGCE